MNGRHDEKMDMSAAADFGGRQKVEGSPTKWERKEILMATLPMGSNFFYDPGQMNPPTLAPLRDKLILNLYNYQLLRARIINWLDSRTDRSSATSYRDSVGNTIQTA